MPSEISHKLLIYHSDSKVYKRIISKRLPQLKMHSAIRPEEALKYIEKADIILSSSSLMTDELLKRASNLLWLASTFAGNEKLVRNPNLPETVLLTKGTSYGARMAEYVFAYLLYFSKNVAKYLEDQKKGVWDKTHARQHPGRLRGQTLGILGLGSIGKVIAQRGKQFGMKVLGLKRSPEPVDHVDQVFGPDQLDRMIPLVDDLVVVLPLTPGTYHFLGRKEMEKMKDGALLINIGRGKVIDQEGLLKVIKTGKIRAVLDVFETEPLPPDSELWALDNVIITPHIAGIERPDELCDEFVLNYERWLRGEPPAGLVDRHRGY